MWAAKILAAALTGAYATGLIPTSGQVAQVAGIAATILAYLGFTVIRARQAVVMLFLLVMVTHGAMACSGSQKAAESSLWSCTESAVEKQLEPTVLNILTSGVANWKEQLAAFARAFGGDEIDCAVSFARALLSAKQGGPTENAAAIARANEYLGGR
jgi:hypothetical protein